MGVSFPATFSSHFNSKAKLGRRTASHSQFSLGEKKGDSLDLPKKGEKLGGGWGIGGKHTQSPREDNETLTTQLLKINHPVVYPVTPE